MEFVNELLFSETVGLFLVLLQLAIDANLPEHRVYSCQLQQHSCGQLVNGLFRVLRFGVAAEVNLDVNEIECVPPACGSLVVVEVCISNTQTFLRKEAADQSLLIFFYVKTAHTAVIVKPSVLFEELIGLLFELPQRRRRVVRFAN